MVRELDANASWQVRSHAAWDLRDVGLIGGHSWAPGCQMFIQALSSEKARVKRWKTSKEISRKFDRRMDLQMKGDPHYFRCLCISCQKRLGSLLSNNANFAGHSIRPKRSMEAWWALGHRDGIVSRLSTRNMSKIVPTELGWRTCADVYLESIAWKSAIKLQTQHLALAA